MRYKVFYKALLVLFLILFIGCAEEGEIRKVQLEAIGLLGEHEIKRIEQTVSTEGFIHGSSTVGFGSLSGNLNSGKRLQIYWGRIPNELVSTTLPYNIFKFVIDESRQPPTIEFVFNKWWFRRWTYLFTESKKSNLNRWLDDKHIRKGWLSVVIVKITKEDLEQDVFSE